MLFFDVEPSSDGSRRPDGQAAGAPGNGVVQLAGHGAQAEGPPTGSRRDLVTGPDGLALAGGVGMLWPVGDPVFGLPALADRRHVGPHLGEDTGQGQYRRAHRVGCLHRLHGLPGSPVHRRGPEKGDHHPGGQGDHELAAEPDDHASGRSRGGLTTKIHLAVDSTSTSWPRSSPPVNGATLRCSPR